MAFGLNLRAINGFCSAQSHRYAKSTQGTQSVKHAKRKTLLKMKRIKDGIKRTRHAKR